MQLRSTQRSWSTQRTKGFTLVEILIVMIVIGILVTIGGGSFSSAQQKGRDARRKGDLKQISNALELYATDHQTGVIFRYPSHNGSYQMLGCGTSGTPTVCAWGSTFAQTVSPSTVDTVYMAQLPSDPKSPTAQYQYRADPAGEWYVLFARLENTLDASVPKTGSDEPMVYNGIMCGSLECNYAISSSNIVPSDEFTLVEE